LRAIQPPFERCSWVPSPGSFHDLTTRAGPPLREAGWVVGLLLVLSACRETATPSLTSIEPASAQVSARTNVVIRGQGFHVKVHQSLSAEPQIDDLFRAFIGTVELEEVRRIDTTTLQAVVPAGLPPGSHSLEIEGPFGTASLPEAWTAIEDEAAALRARLILPEGLRPGHTFTVELEVTNTGGHDLRTVTASAPTFSGEAVAYLGGPEPASIDLARGTTARLSYSLRAVRAGRSILDIAASARDALDDTLVSTTASAEVDLPGSEGLSPRLTPTGERVSVGQTFQVELAVTNERGASVVGVTPVLSLSGVGRATLTSQPPAQDVAAGATASFVWSLVGERAGDLELEVTATGTDGATSEGLFLSAARTTVKIQRPAELTAAIVLPPRASLGQQLSLDLVVNNTGEASAINVTPSVPVIVGPGLLTIEQSPSAQAIPGGASAHFVWTCRAAAAGPLRAQLSASGSDENSGADLTLASQESTDLLIERAAEITASLSVDPATVHPGQAVSVTLEVENVGEAAAEAVVAQLALGAPDLLELTDGPTPAAADVPGGGGTAFVWQYRALSPGEVTLAATARGTDANSKEAVTSPASSAGPLHVLAPATLSGTFSVPQAVNVGQTFEVSLLVSNAGDALASGVAPATLALLGDASATLSTGPLPPTADVVNGAQQVFVWTFVAGASPGSLTFQGEASGADGPGGPPVTTGALSSPTLIVQQPAALSVTLASPDAASPGSTFQVALRARNTGGARALAVTPALDVSGPASVVSGPVITSADIAGGADAEFVWTCRADALGEVTLSASATGTDANESTPLAAGPATALVTVSSYLDVFGPDPFGDGTPVAYVFGYQGKVYLGPNKTGGGAVRADPDGSNLESVSFSLPKDTTGTRRSSNDSAAPFPSIGFTGCTPDTSTCGPDNENGRGLFVTGALQGGDGLLISGSKTSEGVRYAYVTYDSGTNLSFAYVDLSAVALTDQTKSFSAGLLFKGRLYLGAADRSGNRPLLLALLTRPTAPGLEAAAGTDLISLDADKMPGIGRSATVSMIDSLASFNERLYVFNNGGCVRSTTDTPGNYTNNPTDWASCTPLAAAYTGKASVTPDGGADLTPADRAFPQIASHKGRLWAARNTVDGPQLWMCSPASSGLALQCDPGDWSLFAPNSSGDSQLTQFESADNQSISLLVATSDTLFVGFDNPNGIELWKTTAGGTEPPEVTDFERIGTGGLGSSNLRRIFSATALETGGTSYLYLTGGDGTGAVRAFRIGE